MPSLYIHEADVFSTLLNIAYGIKDAKDNVQGRISKNGNKLQASSIARATKDLTMSFPVLCSDTVSYDTACMITKAVERNSIAMLQQLFSAIHLQGASGFEVLANFHHNLDRKLGLDDYFDAIDKLSGKLGLESATSFKNKSEAEYLEEAKRDFLDSLTSSYPISSFSESSVNDFYINDKHGLMVMEKTNKIGLDAKTQAEIEMKERELIQRNYELAQRNLEKSVERKDQLARDAATQKYRDSETARADKKFNLDYFKAQLLPTDVKKANELVPSLMLVKYQFSENKRGANEHHIVSEEFVAGVKARLIATPSFEIIDHIMKFKKNGVNMLNLIKATTKEQKFSKEFILGIKQAKIDAKKDSKLYKTSSIWRSLQKRGAVSNTKFYRLAKTANSAAAITTLVMTQQEADFVETNYNINVSTAAVARELMEAYNLIAIVIVDEQTRVARFLYDGNQYFDEYSFGSLEKESNNDYRKILPLLGR